MPPVQYRVNYSETFHYEEFVEADSLLEARNKFELLLEEDEIEPNEVELVEYTTEPVIEDGD